MRFGRSRAVGFMRRRVSVVAVGVLAAGFIVMVPNAATAGGASTYCPAYFCTFKARGFPGGTISIDADSTVRDGIDRTAYWRIWGPNGYSCGASFRDSEPPRSWVCFNAPAGTYDAAIEGRPPATMGVRW